MYDSENLQYVIIKYVRYNINWLYPQKIINSVLYEHRKVFLPYSAECEYELGFRAKDKPLGLATIFYPPQVKSHNKIKQVEKNGYEFYKTDKWAINTYNAIKNFNREYYKI